MERISSVVEWQTHNRESLGSNPPLHVQAAEIQVLSNTWNQTETFIPCIKAAWTYCKSPISEPDLETTRQGQTVNTTPSTYFGWKVDSGHLVAKLSMLPPVPKACKYIAQYSCSKGCTTLAKGEPDLHGNPTSTGACKCSDGESFHE